MAPIKTVSGKSLGRAICARVPPPGRFVEKTIGFTLFLFDNFVKLQLELVTVISFYILSKVKPVLTFVKNIQNEDFAKVSSNYGIT